MPQAHVFLNGTICPESELRFPQPDLGWFRGLSVFDFLRTQGHQPLALPRYLARFRRSAQAFNLPLLYTDKQLTDIIHNLLKENSFQGEQGVRLLLTGGASPDVFSQQEPTLFIRTEPSHLPAAHFYTKGATLIMREYRREYPQVKHTNYTQVLLAWPDAQRVGAQEVLYYAEGEILECSRSNFFLVKNGTLITPPTDRVLAGVTRQLVLELAAQLGIEVEERTVALEELSRSQEAFITSTTKAVMPIVKIDDTVIGNGKVGPVVKKLLEAGNPVLAQMQ